METYFILKSLYNILFKLTVHFIYHFYLLYFFLEIIITLINRIKNARPIIKAFITNSKRYSSQTEDNTHQYYTIEQNNNL